ncbi:hypothetical protein K2173_027405 [Erythroxylum novogranatense]|uniref:Uncharacterized protein n=1 Tax=Erythroxylum novogranatense TaxID=1862640 RepID=A0AAV8TZ91_9ROSI|nr:hypothetical protein K2173_027405 [Erythroxylum novogranatense]
MLTARSIAPINVTILGFNNRCRYEDTARRLGCPLTSLKNDYGCQFLGRQKLQIYCTSLKLRNAINTKMDMAVQSGSGAGPSLPSDPFPGSWKVWIIGMVISAVLPFWRGKWWPLMNLKDTVESAVEAVDQVADIVEKVAEEVEKVAEAVADHLPEGEIKEAVEFVENLAEETAKGAHLAEEVIDKVEEIGKGVESLIEPAVDQEKTS